MNNDDRPRINWTVIKEFEDKGILVEVSASDTSRPRYTVKIGRRGERGSIPFLQLFTEGQGKIRVVSLHETIAKLVAEAEAFVQERAQAHEDQYLASRIERDELGAQRDGWKPRPSGYKSDRRRERRERDEY